MKHPDDRDTWRNRARKVIADVLLSCGELTPDEKWKRLRDHYPFGERRRYPYKVWLSECHRQIDAPTADDFGQGSLFSFQ